MPIGSSNQKGTGFGDPYQREPLKFIYTKGGLNLARPANLLEPGMYPFVRNIRSYSQGELRTRPGLTALSSGHSLGHSIFRLNDPVLSDYGYFCGVGNEVRFGKTTLATLDAGWSGNPLTAIDSRPLRSPSPLIYIADSNKLRKYDVTGAGDNWGIAIPSARIRTSTSISKMLVLTDCVVTTPTANTESGNVPGAPSNVWSLDVGGSADTSGNRVNTTISQIHYDTGITGYCNIVPAAVTGTEFQPGMRIILDAGGASSIFVLVEQVFPAVKTTTISDIFYDSGAIGPATIVLANSSPGLIANNLIQVGASEIVRIEAVINGPANQPAVRVTLANTYTAGAPVAGFVNFRVFDPIPAGHSIGQALQARYYQWTIGAAGASIGLKHNVQMDLSTLTFSTDSSPVTEDDYVSIGIFIDDISKLVEGRLWICVDPQVTLAYTANDYTRDYYYYPFRASDLQTQAGTSGVTQVQASGDVIQRSYIDEFNSMNQARMTQTVREYKDFRTGQVIDQETFDLYQRQTGGRASIVFRPQDRTIEVPTENTTGINPNPSEQSGAWQIGSGFSRWYQLRFRIGDMIRVGTDKTRTLKDVTSMYVSFTVSGACVVRFSSTFILGGDGPDTMDDTDLNGRAYYYRAVGRNSVTGEISAPSAPTRAGVVTRRKRVQVSLPTTHPDPQVDKIDWYRYGGTLFEWRFIGTCDNTGTPTFVDSLGDRVVVNNPLLDFTTFRPFPTADIPRRGTASITGTMMRRLTGDFFNPNWAPGTLVYIGGVAIPLYDHPASTTVQELTASASGLNNVAAVYTWEIPNPIIVGQPLPVVWGPYGQGQTGLFYFACGDPRNPGTLYFTNANDPNSASDANNLEITSPSAPLIGGLVYDGRPYVFSSEEFFYLNFNPNPQPGESLFSAQRVANSRGAWSYTAIAVDDKIYFAGKDGLYESEGGQPRSLTDDTLYPLFPHDGQPGTDIGPVKAPDYSKPLSMRLQSDGEYLRFIYQAVDDTWNMLLMRKATGTWFYDVYGDGGLLVVRHDTGKQQYRLMGFTGNGNFVQQSGTLDVATPIEARLRTMAFDGGDPRAQKRWGDYMLDLNTEGVITQVTPIFENYTLPEPTQNVSLAARGNLVLELNNGDEKFGVNYGLDITHPGTLGSSLFLYEWQPSWVPKPERTFLRATDWEGFSDNGNVFLQGLLIEADTQGLDKLVQVDTDQGIVATLTLNHPRQSTKPYVIDPPVDVHQVRLTSEDTDSWRLYSLKWIWEPTPEAVTIWQSPPVSHGIPGWLFIREIWLTISGPAAVTLIVNIDGVNQPPITVPGSPTMRTFYLSFYPVKGKLFSYRLTSPSPFQLFETESWVRVGMFSRGGEILMDTQPFGMKSSLGRESAATI